MSERTVDIIVYTAHSTQHTAHSRYVLYMTGMGWLQLVGSIKFKVSYAEYGLFYRALLQKRPVL